MGSNQGNNRCPICGVRYRGQWHEHRCDQRTLDRIDRRHDRGEADPCDERPVGERLAAGFEMLGLNDEEANQ